GGATGLAAVKALAPHGRLLVYGTLSGEPVPLDTRILMVGPRCIEGFWLSNWVREQGVLAMLGLLRRIRGLMRTGVVTTEAGTSFSPEKIKEAVRQAETPGRGGKVLLRISSPG